MHTQRFRILIAGLLFMSGHPCIAGEADVTEVKAQCNDNCRFDVTVRHADQGWEHYANKWDILTPDGQLIATRVLHHPHVDEQPFTRSLNRVEIPAGIDTVIIRAHDSVHGYGGKQMTVKLDQRRR